MRSGVDRIDAGGQSSAAGRDGARESGGADPHPGTDRAGEKGMDPPPAHAHRRCGTGQGEQVHHAACAARGAARHCETIAGQRSTHGHSSGRPGRPCGGARGVPGKRVLGNAGRAQERGRFVGARSTRREDAALGAVSLMRILDWKSLSAAQREEALRRPALRDAPAVAEAARSIIESVRRDGDAAVLALTEQFDGVRPASLQVTPQEFDDAERSLNEAQLAAIDRAIANVRRFHEAQGSKPLRIETSPGVVCERISVPIRAVGLYVPAGSAPLPSTAIMLAVPAAIAACPVRVICTPPLRGGGADPAVLTAARRSGVERVFKAGGAQAVAAMAYGTASIPKCDKIFGPGNAWVTAAKILAAQDPAGAAADLPAGVTEVMVIADDSARADFVAADLLAQAEHSPEAQCLLVTTSAQLAEDTAREVRRQAAALTRVGILAESLTHLRIF